jgi:hypothetical protein
MIQDWANNNEGFIELNGNLAAVGQRHLTIQNQIQQIAALQNLAEAQRRQQMEKVLLEERQNILYDISAALEDVKQLFKLDPAKAYYEFLLLEDFVATLSLEHRMFPSLEWKNHCNKTILGIGVLRAWCNSSLDTNSKESGLEILAQRKLQIKSRENEAARKLEEDQKRDKEEKNRMELKETSENSRKCSIAMVILATVSLIFSLLVSGFSEKADDFFVLIVIIFCFLPILACVGCVAYIAANRISLETNDRKFVYRLTLVGLVIGIFAVLAFWPVLASLNL